MSFCLSYPLWILRMYDAPRSASVDSTRLTMTERRAETDIMGEVNAPAPARTPAPPLAEIPRPVDAPHVAVHEDLAAVVGGDGWREERSSSAHAA